ncbi:MAG: hypothetical protein K1W02_01840 [Muribaculaceae bacterium]|jgi:hypothetical protein
MKKNFLLALDMLQKEKIATLRGGSSSGGKKCGCICFGPLDTATPSTPPTGPDDDETDSSDASCADCGAHNAYRVLN